MPSDSHSTQFSSVVERKLDESDGPSDTQPSDVVSESTTTGLSELLIIRHGERADQVPSDPWHRTAKTRPKDTPLTVLGNYQARLRGHALRNIGVRAKVIYCSPLQRCLETACEIAHELQLPIKVVVPLAKPCHYFRLCAKQGIAPQFADRDEAERILKNMHSDVKLVDFQLDDGSTSRQTMERLAEQSKREQPDESIPQTIIVGHCEAQKGMARVTGRKEKMRAPYCGVAAFELQRHANGVDWSLTLTPEKYDGSTILTMADSK